MTRCLFMGSKKMGLNIFRDLIAESPYKWDIWHPNDFSDRRSNMNEWLEFSKGNKIEFNVLESNQDFENLILANDYEIALVCGWYWKINSRFLHKPSHGFWGIHNSLLPKYRGGSPLIWSLLSDDSKIGSSLFKLEEGMDTGPIALQIEIDNNSTSIEDVYLKIENGYKEKLSLVIEQIMSNKHTLVYQDHSAATYFRSRQVKDSEINFAWTPDFLQKFIKVMQHPYPPAFFKINGFQYFIRNLEIQNQEVKAEIGEIIETKKNRFSIKGINDHILIFDVK